MDEMVRHRSKFDCLVGNEGDLKPQITQIKHRTRIDNSDLNEALVAATRQRFDGGESIPYANVQTVRIARNRERSGSIRLQMIDGTFRDIEPDLAGSLMYDPVNDLTFISNGERWLPYSG